MIEIIDKREEVEFKKLTFSKFKKNDVKKELLKCLLESKIEQCNYWCAELICSGHFVDLWDIIILCMSKHIHYGNPKLPIYIGMRINDFKNILFNGYLDNEIKMRNNNKIRVLFCEIISILCFSQKKNSYNSIKISNNDFNLTEINYKLKANNLSYAQSIFKKDDPKELFVACNELAFCVSKTSSLSNNACYWVEWIFQYENLCTKKKELCVCEKRTNIPVMEKYQNHIVWLVWDILLKEASKRDNITKKIIDNLLNIFCLRYTKSCKTKKRFIIYFVVSLLTEKVDFNIHINNNTEIIKKIISKLDNIYKQIKKSEIHPQSQYLFNGIKQDNLSKTVNKIEKMNNFNFLPRS